MISPLITGLEEACFCCIAPGTRIRSHLHHFFQLDVVLDGSVSITLEDRLEKHCRGGDCVLIPPLVLHGYETKAGFRQATFKFFLAPRFWALFDCGRRRARLPGFLLDGLESGARKLSGGHPLDASRIAALLTLCLGEMSDLPAGNNASPDNLDPFREKLWPLLEDIAREPFRRWTVSGMAARCHMQGDHFSRCFQKVLERAPRAYLVQARMHLAAELLLGGGNLTIEAVADRCGYSSLHAFTRAFTRTIGLSPAAYRRTPGDFFGSDSGKSLSFRGKDTRASL